jgi:hypothetical protein
MMDFMEALNSLDAERMAAFFADGITAFVPNAQAERVDGKPAVVEIFRRYAETTRKTMARTNLVPEDLVVDADRNVAIVTFNVRNPEAVARRTFVFRFRAPAGGSSTFMLPRFEWPAPEVWREVPGSGHRPARHPSYSLCPHDIARGVE